MPNDETPTQPDSTFTESDVNAWATLLGVSQSDAAIDLGLGIAGGVVSIVGTDDQSKRNRNRAKAILQLGPPS